MTSPNSIEDQKLKLWLLPRSAAKLAYSNAQTVIDGEKLPEHVKVYDDHDPEGIASDIKQLDVSQHDDPSLVSC